MNLSQNYLQNNVIKSDFWDRFMDFRDFAAEECKPHL